MEDRKFTKKEAGFGLLEVLIVSSLLGFLALTSAKIIDGQVRASKGLEMGADVTQSMNEISLLLADEARCTASLRTKNASETLAGNIQMLQSFAADGSAQNRFLTRSYATANNLDYYIGSSQMNVESYRLTDAGPETAVVDGTTELFVEFDRNQSGAEWNRIRRIKIGVQVDGTGNITSCRAFGLSDQIWARSEINEGDIFYRNGTVAIGTDRPLSNAFATMLDVARDQGASNVLIRAYSPSGSPNVILRRGRGMIDFPMALQNADDMGSVIASSAAGNPANPAYIRFVASEDHGAGAQGNDLAFGNIPNGTALAARLMTLKNSGRLGVGTETPAALLEISSDTPASDEDDDLNITSFSATYRPALNLRAARGTLLVPANLGNSESAGSQNFTGRIANNWQSLASFRVTTSSNLLTNPGGNLHFTTLQNGVATEVLRLSDTGNVAVGGYPEAANTAFDLRVEDKSAIASVGNLRSSGAHTAGFTSFNFIGNAPSASAGRNRISLYTFRGASTAAASVLSGDNLGALEFNGAHNSNGGRSLAGALPAASIQTFAEQDFGPGQSPGSLSFSTTAAGSATPSERLRITSAGLVGIGTSSPLYRLQVAGQVGAQAYFHTSDRRLKKKIRPLNHALEAALQLQGVRYQWKSDSSEDIGVIAQDVEAIYPELVNTAIDEKGHETKSVKYGNLVAVLIEAIKELFAMFENLQTENRIMKSEIQTLREQNQQILKRLDSLERSH